MANGRPPGDGEASATIEIEVVLDPAWAATLEFTVELYDPVGCELGLPGSGSLFVQRYIGPFKGLYKLYEAL